MNQQRRDTLRRIMALAWSLYRAELNGPSPRTFANALAGAWSWFKGKAARIAAAPQWARGGTVHVRLSSMGMSPVSRSLQGQAYAGRKAWDAGRVTTSLGR
jgi:hypothetical protein